MEADLEILDLVSGPEEGEISEEEDESKDNTQTKYDVTDYSRKDKLSTTVIYDDRGRTTIVGGSEKNNSWPVNYATNDRAKWREKDDEIIVVKKVVVKKSSEKLPKKIRHHSKKRGKHRKHKSRSQEVSKGTGKSRQNAKKSRRSRSVSMSSCSSRSSSSSGNNSDGESSSCSCSSRSSTPTRNRSKSRSPDNKKMRGKENKHGSVSEKKLLNRLRPYSPPKPEPEIKRYTKASLSFSSIKRSFPKKGSSRGTHRISPLSRNETQSNSSGSSSRSKIIGSSRNGKPNSSFSIIKKTRPSSISNSKNSSSISNSKTSNNNKRNTSKDTSKSRNDNSSKPRRKTIESSNVSVSLPGGTAPTPGSIGEMLLKKQRKGVLKAPVPEKDDLKHSFENSAINSISSSAVNENGTENSDSQNRITDNGSNQDAMGQDEDDLLQLRLVALKSSLKVLSKVRQEGREAKKSSQLNSELDQDQHQSDIREIPCEKTSENLPLIDKEKNVLSNCQSPQCEIIEEVYSVDASPLSVLFETALGFSPVNSPGSKSPVAQMENSSQNSQVDLECANDAGDIDSVAISTKRSYLDGINGGEGEGEGNSQIGEILLETEDENQDPVDMDICDSSPEDSEILDEVVILEEVGEDISISNGAIRVRNDLVDPEENDISNFQIPVEWAYMMPPPPPPDQPENNISNFNDWCYDQNMYLQSMQESSYDDPQQVVSYDSSTQSHYQNYQKGQIDSSNTSWQHNQSSSHWNNHYDNSYRNVTDDLLNIPETQNDLPDDAVNVQSTNLDQHEVTEDDGMSKELKHSAAQYYQAFMSAIYTRQNSDSTTDTQNTDTTNEVEILEHSSQSHMEQQIDALLAMSRSKKNALITVVQSQSTRGERKRRRRARMREIRQTKKAEKKALKNQEPANIVLNTSIEISSAQSTSSPAVSSPNVTDDDNEDLDLLRAQLLIDLHNKRSKQEKMHITSEKPATEESSMSSEAPIVKRTLVKKLRSSHKTDTPVQSKALIKKRNVSSMLHDIGGFSLDPKSTRFDFPVPKDVPKDMSKFKFPPVKPVIISLNPDDDTSDEEDERQVELPCTSKSSQSPSTSKEASISTENQSSNVSGKNIDDLLKSFRNASIPSVSQNKKSVKHGKAKAVVKDSSTPNIVRHLSRTQQVEYLQLKEQIRKKEMLQQKRQLLLKQKQKTDATNKFKSLEEKVKMKKISSNNKIREIEEKIKSAKSTLRTKLPDSDIANLTLISPDRMISSEVKESQSHEHADIQQSAVENDTAASHNYSLETKNAGENVTGQPCTPSQENEMLKKNKRPIEMRIEINVTEEDKMNFNVNIDKNILNSKELEKDLFPTSSNKDTSSSCSPALDNEIAQDMNDMDEDEDLLRLMVLNSINRRSGNSTTAIPMERPESDSVNTKQGTQVDSKDEKEIVPNSKSAVQNLQVVKPLSTSLNESKDIENIDSNFLNSENINEKNNEHNEKLGVSLLKHINVKSQGRSNSSALKEKQSAEEMSEFSSEPRETEKSEDEDENSTSDQESDLILPEEWFTVDDVEVLELVTAESPLSQKTSKEDVSILQTNFKVLIPSEDNKCASTDESYTEITFNTDIESKCEGNKSSSQSDLNDVDISIPPKINKVSSPLYCTNENFNDPLVHEINRNADITSNSKENQISVKLDSKDSCQSVHMKPIIGLIDSNIFNIESGKAKDKEHKEMISLPLVEMVGSIESIEEKSCKGLQSENVLTDKNNVQKEKESFSSLLQDKEVKVDDVPLTNEFSHAEDITSEKISEPLISNEYDTEKTDQSLTSNEDITKKNSESLMSEKNCSEEIDNCLISKDSCEQSDKVLISDNDNIEKKGDPLISKEDNSKKIDESLISNVDHTARDMKNDSKILETCAENCLSSTSIGQGFLIKSNTDMANNLNAISNNSKITPSTSIQTSTVTTTTTTSTTSDLQSRIASKNSELLFHKITPISHLSPITHSKTFPKADTAIKTVPLPLMQNKSKSAIDTSNKSTPQMSQPIRKKRLLLLKKIEADYVKRRLNMNSKISTLQGLVQEATDEERQRQAMSERAAVLRLELKKLETNLEVSCRQVTQKMSRIKGLHAEVTTDKRGIAELERKGQMLGQQELGPEYKLPKVLNNTLNDRLSQNKSSKSVKTLSNLQHPPKAMATKISPIAVNNVIPNTQKAVLKTNSIDGKEAVITKSQAIKKAEVKSPTNFILNTTQKSVSSEKTGNATINKPIKGSLNARLSCNVAASKTGEITQKPFPVTEVDKAKNQSNEINVRCMSVKGKDTPSNNYSSKDIMLKTRQTLHDSKGESSGKTNEMDVMCPYDLMGRCNDDSCPYLHLKADKKKPTDPNDKNIEKKSPENSGVVKSHISNVQNSLSTGIPSGRQHSIDVGTNAKDKQRNSEPNTEQKTAEFKSNINSKTGENVLNCEQSNDQELLHKEDIITPSCYVQESQSDPLLNQNEERLSVKNVVGLTRKRKKSFVKSSLSDSNSIAAADEESTDDPLKSKLIMEIDKIETNMDNIENKDVKNGNKFDSVDKNAEIVNRSSSNSVSEHYDILKPLVNSIEMEQEEEKSDENVSLNDKIVTPDTECETDESPTLRISSRKRRLQITDNTDTTDTPRRGRSGSRGRGRGKGRGAVRGKSGSSNGSHSSTRSPYKSCNLEKEDSPVPAKVLKMPSKVSTKETKEAGRGRRGKNPQRMGKRKE